jgi:hypothetical protein
MVEFEDFAGEIALYIPPAIYCPFADAPKETLISAGTAFPADGSVPADDGTFDLVMSNTELTAWPTAATACAPQFGVLVRRNTPTYASTSNGPST